MFALWFICCLSARPYVRTALAAAVAIVQLALLPVIANTPRIARDLEWPVWASYLSSGLPALIPTSPDTFYLNTPATPEGPLARFRSWLGRNIGDVAGRSDPSACSGTAGPVMPLRLFYVQHARTPPIHEPVWISRGTAWDNARNRPVQLVALVDAENRVVGFGLPGFRSDQQAPAAAAKTAGWTAIFASEPRRTVRAYGIVDDGQRICPLPNNRYFPLETKSLTTEAFVGGVEILPGRQIVQRFKPEHRLEAVTLKLVTWGKQPSRYTIRWRIVARRDGRAIELGAGTIDSTRVSDWQRFELPIATVPPEVPDQVEIVFGADSDQPPAAPVGLPLYRPDPQAAPPPAEVDGAAVANGGSLGLDISYAP
ncbi:hypothetical protein [Rhodopseudomonas sp. B29]|uniref:hypothetical protein n=1 Tax=Rhodopseudomonas sp. B29 TaxID=95607 RepID=UPI00034B1736|nr:hypothetical protein [Rhodopseudomonas sp. B29]